ncbi:lipopolysaccharide biosynthesis protein [Mucilaginibacter sp. UR6-11]|uniref:lipopolysaccharide biosynthesis protein n=1 Tax=Mucilaginibacter sp. UR6-11 TaxID=1435644 RepID=UPI001E2D1190
MILVIRKWGNYLRSKWITLIIASAIGGAIGVAYALLQKPLYTAELSFALQDEKSGGGLSSALGLASQFGIDVGGAGGSVGGEFSGDNLLELMKSRSMIEKTLLNPVEIRGKKETLADFYIEFNNFREKWQNQPKLANVHFLAGADRSKFNLTQDSLLGIFHKSLIKNNIAVEKLDKKLSIISIKVTATNELFAKLFTEVLAKTVSDFYIQTKTKKGSQNVKILQRQTDSIRQALNSSISGVASSIDATPNANPAMQTLRVPSQKHAVDVQANTAILSELVKQLAMSKMSLLQETPLIQIIDQPILPLEKEKTSKVKCLILGGLMALVLMIILLSIKPFYKFISN